MDNLGLDQLSDDQLLALVRAALREISARDGAVGAAAERVIIDEAERARIAASATAEEAAALRAAERERIAAEAREVVRRRQTAENAEVNRLRAQQAASTAAAEERHKTAVSAEWLNRAAALVGREPREITIAYVDTNYGRRVLIDESASRYSKNHLVDWSPSRFRTDDKSRAKRPELAALCAELAALFPVGTRFTGRSLP